MTALPLQQTGGLWQLGVDLLPLACMHLAGGLSEQLERGSPGDYNPKPK